MRRSSRPDPTLQAAAKVSQQADLSSTSSPVQSAFAPGRHAYAAHSMALVKFLSTSHPPRRQALAAARESAQMRTIRPTSSGGKTAANTYPSQGPRGTNKAAKPHIVLPNWDLIRRCYGDGTSQMGAIPPRSPPGTRITSWHANDGRTTLRKQLHISNLEPLSACTREIGV